MTKTLWEYLNSYNNSENSTILQHMLQVRKESQKQKTTF